MKLNVGALAAASSLVWGGAVLTVGIANAMEPGYGNEFLRLVASIYPGYKGGPSPEQIAVGTGYALVDGAVGGAIFAALYNCFTCEGRCRRHGEESEKKAA
jgi:hypothetical protein